ncbi:MAG TPA: alpha/beta hydrolase [Humisphaera sp.]
MKRLASLVAVLIAVSPIAAHGQAPAKPRGGFAYPPKIEGATVETYKKVGDVELKAWIFSPKPAAAGAAAADKPRPAIVFFFGGGWTSGSPAQFERQCRHLADRGMVAITADYRVASRQKAKPAECVADAKSCVRWVRANAKRLGVDPGRIVAAGGSAGGHLAAATATLPTLDEPGEDKAVSSVPNAVVLFNPCVVTAPMAGVDLKGFASNTTPEQLGCPREAISPLHHVRRGAPPTLILHGKADTTVPYATVEAFAAAMKREGNRCDLVGYEGQPHGFFNNAKFAETLSEADKFLVSLGYLPPAAVENPAAAEKPAAPADKAKP